MAFNINEIKSQLALGGARPSLFQVTLTNPVNAAADLKFPFMCRAAQMPASTLGLIEVPYFGRKIKIAGDRTFAEWTVTCINDEDMIIRGIYFDHKAETPGLGANIKQRFFMDDFIGESLLDSQGNFKGVTVSKTNLDPKNEDKYDNEVDAIAGSTITGDGVTAMIRSDLSLYQPFFNSLNNN